jgi:hypothetical protein
MHLPYDLTLSSGVSSLVVCVYVYYLLSLGRFSTYHVPSVRRKLRSVGLCGNLG